MELALALLDLAVSVGSDRSTGVLSADSVSALCSIVSSVCLVGGALIPETHVRDNA